MGTHINSLGLAFDMAGVTVLFFFGPAISGLLSDGTELLWTDSDDPGAKRRARRQVRMARAGLTLLFIGFVLQIFGNYLPSAGANRDRIVTRELVVTDHAGKQRATITVDVGGPHLSLADEAGNPTVMLMGGTERNRWGRGPYGGYLAFYDAGHRRKAQLGFRLENAPDGWPAPDDEAGFALYGKDGERLQLRGGRAAGPEVEPKR